MTRLQKLQLRQSELRTALNDELDKDKAERTDGKLEELSAQMKGLEVEVRAALLAEADNGLPADEEKPRDEDADPEEREYRELLDGARAADYFEEQFGTAVDGASKELREHAFGSNLHGFLPIDVLLAGERETRVDAVSDIASAIQENQQSIAGRVFQRADAMYLGAMMPTVPVGTVTYPRLKPSTTKAPAAYAPKVGVERDAGQMELESKSINPQRLTASYVFGVETLSKIRGWEEALRMDLRETMDDKLDELVLNGQAAESDDDGTDNAAFAGLLNSLTKGSDIGTGALDWTDYFEIYDSLVDGLLAYSDMEIAALVGVDLWKLFMKLEAGTQGNSGLLRDRIDRARFRVSRRMAAIASKKGPVLARLSVPDRVRGLYCPTWRGMEVITDPYTGAAKGQRKITAVMIVGCEVIDARAYSYRDLVTSA
ncbi:MAG: phage major capsid protein [Chloroflexota bacterium]|nr:phage major capsid protein [Chloroflexota bacterium]